jgi:hypothetical protein
VIGPPHAAAGVELVGILTWGGGRDKRWEERWEEEVGGEVGGECIDTSAWIRVHGYDCIDTIA